MEFPTGKLSVSLKKKKPDALLPPSDNRSGNPSESFSSITASSVAESSCLTASYVEDEDEDALSPTGSSKSPKEKKKKGRKKDKTPETNIGKVAHDSVKLTHFKNKEQAEKEKAQRKKELHELSMEYGGGSSYVEPEEDPPISDKKKTTFKKTISGDPAKKFLKTTSQKSQISSISIPEMEPDKEPSIENVAAHDLSSAGSTSSKDGQQKAKKEAAPVEPEQKHPTHSNFTVRMEKRASIDVNAPPKGKRYIIFSQDVVVEKDITSESDDSDGIHESIITSNGPSSTKKGATPKDKFFKAASEPSPSSPSASETSSRGARQVFKSKVKFLQSESRFNAIRNKEAELRKELKIFPKPIEDMLYLQKKESAKLLAKKEKSSAIWTQLSKDVEGIMREEVNSLSKKDEPKVVRRGAYIATTAAAAELPPDPFEIKIECRNTNPFLHFLEIIAQKETLPEEFTWAIKVLRREFLQQCSTGADIPLAHVLANFVTIKFETNPRPENKFPIWFSDVKKSHNLAVPLSIGSAVRRLSAMLRPGEDEVVPIRRTLLFTQEDEQEEGKPFARAADPKTSKSRSSVRTTFWERFFRYRNLSRTEFQDLATAPEMSMSSNIIPSSPANNKAPWAVETKQKAKTTTTKHTEGKSEESKAKEILAQIAKTDKRKSVDDKADEARLFAALVKAGIPSAQARTSIAEHRASLTRPAPAPTPTLGMKDRKNKIKNCWRRPFCVAALQTYRVDNKGKEGDKAGVKADKKDKKQEVSKNSLPSLPYSIDQDSEEDDEVNELPPRSQTTLGFRTQSRNCNTPAPKRPETTPPVLKGPPAPREWDALDMSSQGIGFNLQDRVPSRLKQAQIVSLPDDVDRCNYCEKEDLWATPLDFWIKKVERNAGPICVACGDPLSRKNTGPVTYVMPKWLNTSASDEKLLADSIAAAQPINNLDCGSSVSTSASNSDLSEEVRLEVDLKREGADGPGMTYFAACERLQVRPLPQCAILESDASMIVDESLQLMIRSQGLNDRGLLALTEHWHKVKGMSGVKDVSFIIPGNRVTDDGLYHLLSEASGKHLNWTTRIRAIDFSHNSNASARTLIPLSSLLMSPGMPSLRLLRLGGIDLPDGGLGEFTQGLLHSAQNLQELDLSFCGLGCMTQLGFQCVAELLDSLPLKILDISGNHVKHDGFRYLTKVLSDGSCKLEALHLAYNSGSLLFSTNHHFLHYTGSSEELLEKTLGKSALHDCYPAINILCEEVKKVETLKLLDLRSSQLDVQSAFVLACSLCIHPEIEFLLLGGNPMGEPGIRSLLRLLLLNPYPPGRKLKALDLDGCEILSAVVDQSSSFCFNDPTGTYSLTMDNPYDRAVCRQCVLRWQMGGKKLEDTFLDLALDGFPYTWKKNPNAFAGGTGYTLPQRGTLSFTLIIPRKTEIRAQMASTFGEDLVRMGRKDLTPELETRLLDTIQATSNDNSRLGILNAMARDFQLPCSSLEKILEITKENRDLQYAIVMAYIDKMSNPEEGLEIAEVLQYRSKNNISEYLKLKNKPKYSIEFFCGTNPTGFYALDLGNPIEHIMAEQLVLINQWEVECSKSLKRPDVSQKGNYQSFRNERYLQKPFVYASDWLLPNQGLLEFDYASSRRPPRSVRLVSFRTWTTLTDKLMESDLPSILKVLCLKRYSFAFYCSCNQVKDLMVALSNSPQGFPKAAEQALFTTLFFRIKDYTDAPSEFFSKVAGRAYFSEKDLHYFDERIGRIHLINCTEIQNIKMVFDLSVFEDRMVCRVMMMIGFHESGKTIGPTTFAASFFGPTYNDMHAMMFPSRWALHGLPMHGILSAVYIGGDGPDMNFRKDVARRFCGWDV